MEEQETTSVPQSRKRQLEVIDSDLEREDKRDSESSPPSPKVPASSSVLDEIELHFQRSLANMKSSQKSPLPTATATNGNHTHSAVFRINSPQNSRETPSPNRQSRLTPPISSSSPSSLSSSQSRRSVHGNKPLPPPLKLASPTSESQSTVQSLYAQQHHRPHHPTIRASSATKHQAIVLPTVTTATGLTSFSRQSPPSSVTGPPVLTLANGLPSRGTSPPSVAQIQALPTISTAALGSGGIYLTSPQFLSSQQAALHQALSNGSSLQPKRSLATATIAGTSTASTTIPVANNSCGALAAVQLTPGGPLLALSSNMLQPSSTEGNSGQGRSRVGRSILTGLNIGSGVTGAVSTGTVATGGSYQIQAPSVTQPGSMHIIDLPIESTGGKSSPPTPFVATAPTLPKAPSVVNVSQIPNLITINPSSPNSPSPGSNKSTPTVKVVGVSSGSGSSLLSGTQSPIRVSAASAQTTPIATPTLITPQQLAANSPLLSVIDPSASAQILAAGNTGCSPVYIIPSNSMPMVQQPFFVINPSTSTATDLSSIQQLQQASILATNPSLAGASLVSNPAGGGYLLVSPGSAGTAGSFSMPLVNLASTTSANSSQPAIPSLIPASPVVTAATLKPVNKATILYSTGTSTSSSSATAAAGGVSSNPGSKPPSTKPPLKNQSSSDSVPSPAHSDVMMTPASVDDHFAQALGPQWNKLKSHNSMQPQKC